jgi:uncharacterized protein (DUF433 family)
MPGLLDPKDRPGGGEVRSVSWDDRKRCFMPDNAGALTGVVHGRIIELERDPGLPDGQTVTITLQYATIVPSEPIPEDVPGPDSWLDRLVFDSSVLPGIRIVKGTKLAAESLVTEVEQGASDDALLQAHAELAPEDVQALRAFARVPAWIRHTAGAWAEDADELDDYLETSRQQRKVGRREVEG